MVPYFFVTVFTECAGIPAPTIQNTIHVVVVPIQLHLTLPKKTTQKLVSRVGLGVAPSGLSSTVATVDGATSLKGSLGGRKRYPSRCACIRETIARWLQYTNQPFTPASNFPPDTTEFSRHLGRLRRKTIPFGVHLESSVEGPPSSEAYASPRPTE